MFEDDFKKQHTLGRWQRLLTDSSLLQVEICEELADANILYEELVRYEHVHQLDPVDVEICLVQTAWGGLINCASRCLF